MSGTSLVILAMYSTVNVVGPVGAGIPPAGMPAILALLMASAALTCCAMLSLHSAPPRRTRHQGPFLPSIKRQMTGPRDRRR